ncbi:MAG: immune inhibitor A, partial [Candidatus Latescibacteria bacterium]|nr:immune inhibitor A [Candidatus Latescibacterota bacterium]
DGEVDFSEYDNDGPDGLPNSGDDDGYVDMVFINLNSRPKRFFDADLQDATGIALLGLSEDFITDDRSAEGEFIRIGEKSGTTQWVWSFAHAVGSMAHEFGHTLGLVDLYDTKYEGPNDDSAGIGNWGLMGRGVLGWHGDVDPDGPVPFSAWSRLWLGWIGELVEVKEDMQGVRLEDVALGGKVVRIQISKYEYFILVNRQPTGNYYDRELPKGGLLIWHIGPGANWWEENKRADLECPDGLYRDRGYPNGVDPDPVFGKDNLDFWAHDAAYRAAHNGNLGDATDVFDGVRFTAFGPDTNPASTSKAGNPTGIYVRNIRFEGATAVVDIHPRPVMVVTDEVTFLDENWDQVIESGEKVHVRIRLKNVGGVAVKGLQCRLRTNDPYVVLEDSVASFGELPVGDTATRDTLQFKVAGGFWRQHTATFELEIRDADGNVWVETTEADFVSPQIPLKGLVVLDGGAGSIRGFGNGDGVPNPGETIGLQAVTESPEELSPFNVVFGTEDALVRRMGSSFLIASNAPPGHRISFETQVEGHFAAYRDTLYVEVIGKDETPPQVLHTFSDPSAMEPGTSTTIKVPKRSIVEGGRISRIEARIYALTDLERVDTVVLQEKSEEFHGVWSYPGTGRFHVRIFAEDEAGNGTESRPLDVLVFYIPSGPPSSGE